MELITKDNVIDLLMTDRIIGLWHVYSYKTPKWWEISVPIHIKLIYNNKDIIIEPGFDTDGSSSPRWLWSFLPPFGDFLFAAIVHDYLYVERPFGITQEEADKEMYNWSQIINDNRFDNKFRYWWVRMLGWLAWEKKLGKYFNKEIK